MGPHTSLFLAFPFPFHLCQSFFFSVVKAGYIFLQIPTSYPMWEEDVSPLTYEQQDLDPGLALTAQTINMNPSENLFLGLEMHLG